MQLLHGERPVWPIRHSLDTAECLAEIAAVPLSTMRATTTGLLEAGSPIMAPEHPCPLCQKHPALMLPGGSMRRLFRLIVVRSDRPETLRNILGATDPWPPGTAVMLDRRVGERRAQSRQATLERRREPRRAEPDAMWHTHEFIVVETQRHPSPGRVALTHRRPTPQKPAAQRYQPGAPSFPPVASRCSRLTAAGRGIPGAASR